MMNLSSLSRVKKISLVLAALSFTTAVCIIFSWPASITLPLLTVSMVLGIWAYFDSAKTEKEIFRTKEICRSLSMGDFEARIVHIKDKGAIGLLQSSINQMADVVDAFVREASASMEYVSKNQYFRRILEPGLHGSLLNATKIINVATQSVQEKMDAFADVAHDLDSSLSDVAQDTAQMVNALSETATNMQNTVSVTRDDALNAVNVSNTTLANVQAISAASTQMSAAIGEIAQQMNHASSIAKQAVSTSSGAENIMKDLTQTVSEIGEITTMIETIAGQTNLLALNATIEAARAGEIGKGFAVVASEVKTLASQTGEATDKISSLVKAIEQAVNKAVLSFSGIGDVIGKIDESTTVVAAAIEEQNAAFQEIAMNTERTSQGTQEVARSIRSMESGVGQVDHSARGVVDVTNRLSHDVSPKIEQLLSKMSIFMAELHKIA